MARANKTVKRAKTKGAKVKYKCNKIIKTESGKVKRCYGTIRSLKDLETIAKSIYKDFKSAKSQRHRLMFYRRMLFLNSLLNTRTFKNLFRRHNISLREAKKIVRKFLERIKSEYQNLNRRSKNTDKG